MVHKEYDFNLLIIKINTFRKLSKKYFNTMSWEIVININEWITNTNLILAQCIDLRINVQLRKNYLNLSQNV